MLYIFVSYCLSFSFRFFLSVCCYAVKERDCAVETNIAVHYDYAKTTREMCAQFVRQNLTATTMAQQQQSAGFVYRSRCTLSQVTKDKHIFFPSSLQFGRHYFHFQFFFRHSFDPIWEDDLLSINCLGRSVHVILVLLCVLFGCMRCAWFSVLNFAYHVLFWHDDSRTWINKNKNGKQKYLHTESWKVREA